MPFTVKHYGENEDYRLRSAWAIHFAPLLTVDSVEKQPEEKLQRQQVSPARKRKAKRRRRIK